MEDKDAKPLDYGNPRHVLPTPQRKETIDLFREPPAIVKASLSDVIFWVVSFVVIIAVILSLLSRWLSGM